MVTGVSRGFGSFSSSGGGSDASVQKILEKLNDKFGKRVVIKSANRLTPGTFKRDEKTTNILISPEFLKEAEADPEMYEKLESIIKKLKESKSITGTINMAGKDISIQAFTIDRKGNISCLGSENDVQKGFGLKIGKVGSGTMELKEKLMEHLDIGQAAYSIASYKYNKTLW